MTHWGWYWKVKKQHKPRKSCSAFITIDSFEMFRNKEGVEWCRNKVAYEIPRYNLKAILLNSSYQVEYNEGSYSILFEQQACNYGGFRYFFHCPRCDKRMRILYCKDGKFLCRKCLNLGYYTQRLRPSERCLIMAMKVKESLKNRAGGLYRKPPWMKRKTFETLRERYFDYDDKWMEERDKEFIQKYPHLKHTIRM